MAYIWNTEDGNVKMELDYHKKNVLCITYSPCNFYVATASEDETGVIWNLTDGTIERILFLDGIGMSYI